MRSFSLGDGVFCVTSDPLEMKFQFGRGGGLFCVRSEMNLGKKVRFAKFGAGAVLCNVRNKLREES